MSVSPDVGQMFSSSCACLELLPMSVPGRNPDAEGVELHVLLVIFILRGTGLLGRVGRRGCELRLLCCLLHLQPLLLSDLCLLLPRLHTTSSRSCKVRAGCAHLGGSRFDHFITANITDKHSSLYYVICSPLIILTLANNSCCWRRSSSSGMPRFSRRELAFLRFKATVLHSCSTSFTSVM